MKWFDRRAEDDKPIPGEDMLSLDDGAGPVAPNKGGIDSIPAGMEKTDDHVHMLPDGTLTGPGLKMKKKKKDDDRPDEVEGEEPEDEDDAKTAKSGLMDNMKKSVPEWKQALMMFAAAYNISADELGRFVDSISSEAGMDVDWEG